MKAVVSVTCSRCNTVQVVEAELKDGEFKLTEPLNLYTIPGRPDEPVCKACKEYWDEISKVYWNMVLARAEARRWESLSDQY